jgi:3-oxoacyl-[acyl-carrier protein] reductase
MTMSKLEGRVAIVTGGGQGIGAGIADVSLEPDVRLLFAQVREAYGPVDLLVNNAGVWHFQPITDVSVAEYRRHYDTNVLGNVLTSREFALQAEADGGAIVNLTSVGIDPAAPGTSLYIGTKSAIAGMTRVLAVELAPRRIRVNAVAAGLIDTEGTRASGYVGSAAADEFVQTIPLQRMGTAYDVAAVVTFLASDDARYVTGDVISSPPEDHNWSNVGFRTGFSPPGSGDAGARRLPGPRLLVLPWGRYSGCPADRKQPPHEGSNHPHQAAWPPGVGAACGNAVSSGDSSGSDG